jgi:hypothetical protein
MKRFDKGSFWNPDDEKFYFSQKEMKVGEEKNDNFVSDSEFYLLDQYWLFSIYFLIGGGSQFIGPNNSHGNFIFPDLYDKESRSKGAGSAFIASILRTSCLQRIMKGKLQHHGYGTVMSQGQACVEAQQE